MKDEEEKKKIKEDKIEKAEKAKSIVPKWFKFFLGSIVFLGSTVGLIYLFRTKARFTKI